MGTSPEVHVVFPVIPPSAVFDHTPEREPPSVLVVDDEPELRAVLRRLLESSGFFPVEADCLDTARQRLKSHTFDAALVDLRLGPELGLDVLWEITRVQPDCARILMSANVDVYSVMDAVNGVGVYQVVEKPLRHEVLLQTLDRACSLTRVVRERDRLQAQLEDRTRALEKLTTELQETVHRRTSDLLGGLLAALDFRDTETQAHSRRVAAYARRLGSGIGLTGSALADVTAGALLHDVGKIGVPDHILRKPGPLTADEWFIMQKHPVIGDELLAPIAILQGARRVVLEHHERFDGTGYPRGMVGAQIDVGARIFAIVDAHDAITSDRPHRKGRSIVDAREMIELASGTQFDPVLVTAWLAVPEQDLMDIQDLYQDTQPFTGLGELLTGWA